MRKAVVVIGLILAGVLLAGCKEKEPKKREQRERREKQEKGGIALREKTPEIEAKEEKEPLPVKLAKEKNLTAEKEKIESGLDIEYLQKISEEVLKEVREETIPKKEKETLKLATEPLPNGVVFDGNISIAIIDLKRKGDASIAQLAFRKVGKNWTTSNRGFWLRITDDRDNKYKGSFFPNRPPGIGSFPIGFTWVDDVEIKIPGIAPIAKIEINEGSLGRQRPREETSSAFQLNVATQELPNFEFEIEPNRLLSPGEKIEASKDLSFWLAEIEVKDEVPSDSKEPPQKGLSVSVPIIVKNSDYNIRVMSPFTLFAQLDNGRIIRGKMTFREDMKISSLSSKRFDILTNIRFEEGTGVPRLFFLYWSDPEMKNLYCHFIAISPKEEEQILDARNSWVRLERAKHLLKEWQKENTPRLLVHGLQFHDYEIVGGHIWAAGYLDYFGGYGRLVHSPDGGKTWEVQWESKKSEARQVHFFDEKEGMFVNSEALLKTNDGGKSWSEILLKREIRALRVKDRHSMVVDERFETNDGGKTWKKN